MPGTNSATVSSEASRKRKADSSAFTTYAPPSIPSSDHIGGLKIRDRTAQPHPPKPAAPSSLWIEEDEENDLSIAMTQDSITASSQAATSRPAAIVIDDSSDDVDHDFSFVRPNPPPPLRPAFPLDRPSEKTMKKGTLSGPPKLKQLGLDLSKPVATGPKHRKRIRG